MSARLQTAHAVVLAATLLATGCIMTGPSDLRTAVSDVGRVPLDSDVSLSLGPLSLGLARMAVPDEARDEAWFGVLRGVRRVQVGVYRVDRMGRRGPDFERIAALHLPHHVALLTVRAPDSVVRALMRIGRRDEVREIIVVAADAEEVVITRLEGRLDEVLGRVVALSLGGEEGHEELRRGADRSRG